MALLVMDLSGEILDGSTEEGPVLLAGSIDGPLPNEGFSYPELGIAEVTNDLDL